MRATWSLAVFGLAVRCLGQPITPAESIALFNATNLQGFYTWLVDSRYHDPRAVFTVTNRTIRISGNGLGYLATKASYANYRLVVEFQWGARNWPWGERLGRARDSGLFLHAFGPDGNSHDGAGAFKAAIECQIMQGAVGDLLLIRGSNTVGRLLAARFTAQVSERRDREGWFYWSPTGGQPHNMAAWGRLNWFNKAPDWEDKLDFRGRADVEGQPGDWTRVECICERDTISILVNGTLVNQVSKVFPSEGQILLQCEGSEIYFRKVELHPLEKSAQKQ